MLKVNIVAYQGGGDCQRDDEKENADEDAHRAAGAEAGAEARILARLQLALLGAVFGLVSLGLPEKALIPVAHSAMVEVFVTDVLDAFGEGPPFIEDFLVFGLDVATTWMKEG